MTLAASGGHRDGQRWDSVVLSPAAAPTVAGMTRPDAARAAASWPDLTAALRELSDEDFAALTPGSIDLVAVPVQVRFGVQGTSAQG